ncbi:MAG TPA: F0F1 ATP synthase subunit beta, partial [Armatimonadetes bacterium]|nr:F0F1 ATP synthase subunit beta [Armatimonadota bacterium]
MAVTGKVVQVIGPVVDCEFPTDTLPEIYNAIQINARQLDQPLIVEVAQ